MTTRDELSAALELKEPDGMDLPAYADLLLLVRRKARCAFLP